MKKYIALALIGLAIVILTSCGQRNEIVPAEAPNPCYTIPPFETSDMMWVCEWTPPVVTTAAPSTTTATTDAAPTTATTAAPTTATVVIQPPRPRVETLATACPTNVDTP